MSSPDWSPDDLSFPPNSDVSGPDDDEWVEGEGPARSRTRDPQTIPALGADAPTMVEELPPGWRVWNEEVGGRVVLAYRPDVFDAAGFPPACLPTIAVAPGDSPDQLPERRARSTAWHRALYLEPAVRVRDADERYPTRDTAVAGAEELAARFAAGEVDYRGAYQQPREAYLDRLDELVDAGE